MAKELHSFQDLAAHLKPKLAGEELAAALAAARGADPTEAADLLDRMDRENVPVAEREVVGKCYARAAIRDLGCRDYGQAGARLRRALEFGFRAWYVERRLELLNSLRSGRLDPAPPDDWLDRFKFRCPQCAEGSPTALQCARCTHIARLPSVPVAVRHLNDVYALGVYRWRGDPDAWNALSRMVRFLKRYKGGVVVGYLAFLLVAGLREATEFLQSSDLMIPVPADPERCHERGFDNVAELVREMEGFALVPQAAGALVKTRPTPDLRGLSRSERRRALEGSISVRSGHARSVEGARVLVVDDVVTSGATLDLCAQVLLQAGAETVRGAVLARSESTQVSLRG